MGPTVVAHDREVDNQMTSWMWDQSFERREHEGLLNRL